ncbi:MAG TPA: hypothetical protein VFX58_13630 [Chitinophagaceae bacterium]|nr:hypothetical protein [Chitinophagaceae bacterium]
MRRLHSIRRFTILIFFILLLSTILKAQYFGRNKVNYRDINFRVLQSPHFEFYHYLDNTERRNRIAQQTEQWYRMHQLVFRDTFQTKNPVILYNNHADFQQTNTISGLIGVGTGGVTEALKNRVIMPFMETNAQTDHVLGHELVHAFQYQLVRGSDSLSLNSLRNLPLWMVEGLAEYMSIGYIDPHTAIWLRSAILHDKVPTLKLLTNRPYEYFPYRWGQAFWAYVTGIWGDNIIKPLFVATARTGYEDAVKRVLGIDEKTFSAQWKKSLQDSYAPYRQLSSPPPGRALVTEKNAGELNVVPSLSPDGKMLAFWSEKSLFNLDLFLADAETGKLIEKLTSVSFGSHIDEFNSFESSVAWSPDSRNLAFVVFAKGRNRLLIVNNRGKIQQHIDLPGVTAFSNPTWSPDGSTIVVTGLVDGQSDLYAYNLQTKKVRQLTNDRYADIQPSFSPDGQWIVFSTDRLSIASNQVQHQYAHHIALMNFKDQSIRVLDVFKDANNLNPVFAKDNNTIYFLSDQDGFRNLYTVDATNGQVAQLTNLYNGITGITLYAPAISVSRQNDLLVYTYYDDGKYILYKTSPSLVSAKIVVRNGTGRQAAQLPPFNRKGNDFVQRNIVEPAFPPENAAAFIAQPYRSKFRLDYIGNTGVGVSTGAGYGTGVGGGVNGIFSDMLGNHQLFASVAINGEIYDFGGQFAYLNAHKRLNWGASFSHIPYVTGLQRLFKDTLVRNGADTVEVANFSTDLLRTFEDQVSLFAAYPFSQTRRIEGGVSFARYYYRMDRYTDYYTLDGQYYIGSAKRRLDAPGGFNFGQAYLAFVGDNSQFGIASPLVGHRFRFEASKYAGIVNLQSLLGDYRKYFRLAPFTIAMRNMFEGRYGQDAESGILPPLYIGYPFYIRGYEATEFAEEATGEGIGINDLIGSRIFVTNAELRFPLTGPERLSAIRSRFLLTELALFTDGGIAWGNPLSPSNEPKEEVIPRTAKFILSSGISLRINLFGYMVIEPFYAIPWQNRGFKNANFGLNFFPGW